MQLLCAKKAHTREKTSLTWEEKEKKNAKKARSAVERRSHHRFTQKRGKPLNGGERIDLFQGLPRFNAIRTVRSKGEKSIIGKGRGCAAARRGLMIRYWGKKKKEERESITGSSRQRGGGGEEEKKSGGLPEETEGTDA